MIANELNRAENALKRNNYNDVKLSYEYAYELIYLTIETLQEKRKLKELLRFKEMLGMMYLDMDFAKENNYKLMKCLVYLDKDSANLLKL